MGKGYGKSTRFLGDLPYDNLYFVTFVFRQIAETHYNHCATT